MKYLDKIEHVQGPYVARKTGRKIIHLWMKDGRRRPVSYPKFLVEVILGRELKLKQETVDHIDGNFRNNTWSNLRIIDHRQHVVEDAVRVRLVALSCVWCSSTVKRRPSVIKADIIRCKTVPFCSRSCAGKYVTAVRDNKLPLPALHYNQWSRYVNITPVYYTVNKGGETIADTAKRCGLALHTEDEILAALPRQNRTRTRVRTPKVKQTRSCAVCSCDTTNKKYCSAACAAKGRRKSDRPSKEELHRLVWQYPTLKLAEYFGVSDVALAKWCKQYGIDKPPRGYWAKKRAAEKQV